MKKSIGFGVDFQLSGVVISCTRNEETEHRPHSCPCTSLCSHLPVAEILWPVNLPNRKNKVQECDATMLNTSTEAGFKKISHTILERRSINFFNRAPIV